MTVAEPHVVPRGTAILLTILAGLIGYLWLFELRPRERPAPVDEPPPLLVAAPNAVARVELREAGRTLLAVRTGDGWTDGNGQPWRDADPVTDLVATLGSLRPLMVLAATPDTAADYGLGADPPRLTVGDVEGRSLLVLELGERNPAATGLYVRADGRPDVLLVGAVLGWELRKLRDAAPDNLTTPSKTHETPESASRATESRRDR